MNLRKSSSQIELDEFFQAQQPQPLKRLQTITKSAFFQARKYLSHKAFITLNHHAVTTFYSETDSLKTWKEFRLCAVDGSKIRLPNTPDVVESFGEHTGRKGSASCAMGLASVYFDVLNQIVIDGRLDHGKGGELDAAVQHLKYSSPKDLVLYDRNYNAFWFYALHHEQQRAFCMRGKVNGSALLTKFVKSGKIQTTITMTANAEVAQRCFAHNVPSAPLKLRLVRVELGSEVEVLITNLIDEGKYDADDFKSLYHLRWGIEELYKRMKQWVEIENFSGKSALSVRQDFHAHLLGMNLTAFIAIASQKVINKQVRQRRYNYQVNFAQALSKMKHVLVRFLKQVNQNAEKGFIEMVYYIALSMEPIRSGRSFPRKMPSQKNKRHFINYKSSR